MKQFRHVYALAILVVATIFASCQKEDHQPLDSEQEVYTQFVDLSGDLDEIDLDSFIDLQTGQETDAESMRMAIKNRTGNNGVSFDFTVGEEISIHLFFKQGDKMDKITHKVRVAKNQAGKFTLSKTGLGLPSNSAINLSAGGVTVSGAIGVINPRIENGKFLVDVPNPATFKKTQPSYVVPMYFPATPIERLANGNYGFYTHFKFYGSIVGIPMQNAKRTTFRLKTLGITTPAFETEGTMDLATASAAAAPAWTSKQGDTSVKNVNPGNDEGYITVNKQSGSTPTIGWYFFWVKPKKTVASGAKMTLSFTPHRLITNNQINPSGSVITAEVPVRKALQENLVHRTPNVAMPQIGELIISEVYRGDNDYRTAFEFYNTSDEDINLWHFEMRSYNSNGSLYATSPLLEYSGVAPAANDRLVIIRDRNKGYNFKNRWEDAILPNPGSGYLEREVILKPGHNAVFMVADHVPHERSIINPHMKCTYVFHYNINHTGGFKILNQGGYVELWYNPTRRPGQGELVDAFLKVNSQAQNSFNIWAYTMMRKPDRNTPRQYMQLGQDTDWVVRRASENIDFGSRFGFYQTGTTVAGIYWVNGSGYSNGYAQSRPMLHVTKLPASHSYYWGKSTVNEPEYVKFPTGWTQAVATNN